MQLIAQGAEAKLFRDKDTLIKERIPKSYRLKEIDDRLRKQRTKREAKVLTMLEKAHFPAPKLISVTESKLVMEFITGNVLKEALDQEDYVFRSAEIGRKVALLHNLDIIHGDLTTSNMILNKEIYFVDFGLSFFSKRAEDKAVDLHLFRQALESRHHTIWEKCFKAFLDMYKKNATEANEILARFKQVELRGRNKAKY